MVFIVLQRLVRFQKVFLLSVDIHIWLEPAGQKIRRLRQTLPEEVDIFNISSKPKGSRCTPRSCLFTLQQAHSVVVVALMIEVWEKLSGGTSYAAFTEREKL